MGISAGPIPTAPPSPQRSRRFSWRMASACVALGFAAGSVAPRIFFRLAASSPTLLKAYAVRQSSSGLTSPLLECEVMDARERERLAPLQRHLTWIVANAAGQGLILRAGVYFRDLTNGAWFGVNEDLPFAPASLLKVPVMIAWLKQVESDPTVLARTFAFAAPMSVFTPNFPTVKRLKPGRSYSVVELLERMIRYSDNDALDLLSAALDSALLHRTYVDLGMILPEVSPLDDFMSARSYASFFRVLYNASYLDRDMSERALTYLANTDFTQGLAAGVPAEIPVAHKFGERKVEGSEARELHDCGIVYEPGRPYLLCVMTRGRDYDQLLSVIRDVSREVFRHVAGAPASPRPGAWEAANGRNPFRAFFEHAAR